jgi:hypothetical protein
MTPMHTSTCGPCGLSAKNRRTGIPQNSTHPENFRWPSTRGAPPPGDASPPVRQHGRYRGHGGQRHSCAVPGGARRPRGVSGEAQRPDRASGGPSGPGNQTGVPYADASRRTGPLDMAVGVQALQVLVAATSEGAERGIGCADLGMGPAGRGAVRVGAEPGSVGAELIGHGLAFGVLSCGAPAGQICNCV